MTACDFMDAGKAQIIIESEVDAALIYGDRLRGHERIVNHAAARAQIALNVVTQVGMRTRAQSVYCGLLDACE